MIFLFAYKQIRQSIATRFFLLAQLLLVGWVIFRPPASHQQALGYIEFYASCLAMFLAAGLMSSEATTRNLELNFTRTMSFPRLFLYESIAGAFLSTLLSLLWTGLIAGRVRPFQRIMVLYLAAFAIVQMYFWFSAFMATLVRGYFAPALTLAFMIGSDITIVGKLDPSNKPSSFLFNSLFPVRLPAQIASATSLGQGVRHLVPVLCFSAVCAIAGSQSIRWSWKWLR